jgi:DivIVA domain-containing protein
VALERQRIEKKDFPIGRRGYDPDAVDAHLSALADEVEEFKRSSRQRTETLATAASDQVRSIVEAAESSAAEIQRQADEDASELRAEAKRETQATREQATAQAREYVGNVSQATATMLERLDAIEGELGTLIQSLRTGSGRINADLQLLGTNLEDVRNSVSPRSTFQPEGAPPQPAVVESVSEEPGEVEEQVEVEVEIEEVEIAAAEPEPAAVAGGGPTDGSDDTEGARLIALNMALNGTPREETDKYLSENFELNDRAALLDEVYASVGG